MVRDTNIQQLRRELAAQETVMDEQTPKVNYGHRVCYECLGGMKPDSKLYIASMPRCFKLAMPVIYKTREESNCTNSKTGIIFGI